MQVSLRTLAAAALLALPALAQGSVLVVDATSGPFTTIQAAINAGTDGDTLLVKAGSYQGFSIFAKSLTIAGESNQSVNISGTVLVQNLSSSQTVVLRGVHIVVPFVVATLTPPPTLLNNSGAVWIEDCTIVDINLGTTFSGYQGHGFVVDNCASAVFIRTSLTGSTGAPSGDGIHAVNSSVSLHDCMLRGADAALSVSNSLAGGDGLTQNGGFLFASGTSFVGGKGGNGTTASAQGIPPICHNGGTGGNGMVLSGLNPAANLLGCSFTPGVGGLAQTNYGCTPGLPGQPSIVNAGSITTLAGVARHYFVTSPIRGGMTTTLTFQAPAGESAFVAFWNTPTQTFYPAFFGPLLVGGTPIVLSMGTIPASGTLSVLISVPDPSPGLVGTTFFSQGLFIATPGPFLGPPSVLSALNSAIP